MMHAYCCLRSRLNYVLSIHHFRGTNQYGEAFKDLSKEDLKEMGFKMGPRNIITKIIEDLKK
jgi:hypothetical protein